MWDAIKNTIGTVAPAIGTAIGGPFGGMAGAVLSKILTGKSDSSPQEIENAYKNASPEIIYKLKQADLQFKVRIAELEKEEAEIAAKDRQSARESQKFFVKLGKIDFMCPVLGAGMMIGVFSIIYLLFIVGAIPAEVKAILDMVLGSLLTCLITTFQFYFGSSKGSARKTEMLAKNI